MPNICITEVFIIGPEAAIAHLRTLFDFEAIIATPALLPAASVAEEDRFSAGIETPGVRLMIDVRYVLRLKEWGGKGLYVSMLADKPERLAVRINTAWSPPHGALKAVSERFPELEFAIVAHDVDGPRASAWRSVAGIQLDQEVWESDQEAWVTCFDAHEECDDWVDARIRRFEELPTT